MLGAGPSAALDVALLRPRPEAVGPAVRVAHPALPVVDGVLARPALARGIAELGRRARLGRDRLLARVGVRWRRRRQPRRRQQGPDKYRGRPQWRLQVQAAAEPGPATASAFTSRGPPNRVPFPSSTPKPITLASSQSSSMLATISARPNSDR